MAAKSDLARIEHMLEYGKRAFDYCKNKRLSDLLHDPVGQSHIIRSLEIVGEAAYWVSRDFQSKYPDVPWPLIIGMRHRLIHAYADINIKTVWQTVVESLPSLIPLLEAILQAEGSGDIEG
jgi:uncharacterized protein with HEPN domain